MIKRNDPLVNSVKQVMAENQIRRDVEKQLNEELGIHSKKALPFEQHAEYDALLEQRIAEALHPNQQKLDVHEPEKDELTKQDFVKLRAMKKEEVDTGESDARKSTPSSKEKNDEVFAKHRKRMKEIVKEEEGEETREGGAVKYNGKTVVSPTAHKAQPEGPSKSDRDALTAKIKGIMKEAAQLDEKAVSKAQQRFFGLVRGIQKGEAKGSEKAEKAAKEMSTKEVRKYAKTKQKGLPEKVDEDFDLDAVMEEIRANLGEAKMNKIMEARPEKFRGTFDQFKQQNQGATLGQFMNAQRGLTARAGGANDPEVIAARRAQSSNETQRNQPVYTPRSGTTMRSQAQTQSDVQAARADMEQGAAMSARAAPSQAATRTPPPRPATPPAVSDKPITAPKGEGAAGRALADLGVSKELRGNQEFVTNTLGNDPATGKPYVARSAAANLALKAKLSQQAGDRQGSDDLREESESLNSTIKKVLKG